jgi:hypothetical protein
MATDTHDSTSVPNDSPHHNRQKNARERIYKCTIVYSEYDDGHDPSRRARELRRWKSSRKKEDLGKYSKDVISCLIVSAGVLANYVESCRVTSLFQVCGTPSGG